MSANAGAGGPPGGGTPGTPPRLSGTGTAADPVAAAAPPAPFSVNAMSRTPAEQPSRIPGSLIRVDPDFLGHVEGLDVGNWEVRLDVLRELSIRVRELLDKEGDEMKKKELQKKLEAIVEAMKVVEIEGASAGAGSGPTKAGRRRARGKSSNSTRTKRRRNRRRRITRRRR